MRTKGGGISRLRFATHNTLIIRSIIFSLWHLSRKREKVFTRFISFIEKLLLTEFCTFSHRHSFPLLFTFYDLFWGLTFCIFWPTTVYAQSIVYIQWKELKFIFATSQCEVNVLWIKTQLNGHNSIKSPTELPTTTTFRFSIAEELTTKNRKIEMSVVAC